MSKYTIESVTLNGFADEIRTMVGTENLISPDEMTAHLAYSNEEIAAQEKLIAQIKTLLENKTAGSTEKIPDGYILPSGTKDITENGIHDVTEYASVNVNVPTGGGADSELPEGYSRCDYIRFTGEQIVDTRIVCNQNTKIHLAFTREKSTQHYLFGVASSNNAASVTAYLGGSWRFGNKTATKTPNTNENMFYSGIVDGSQITISGNATTISGTNEFETIGSLLIGACRSATGDIGAAQFEGKILFLIMEQGDEQVLKLQPFVSAEGEYRFFDTVSKTFFDSITDTPLSGGNL